MDHETYKQESKRTLSDGFYPTVVNPVAVLQRLAVFEHMALSLDNDKKGLFYGREPKNIPQFTAPVGGQFQVNELHALLGLITEVAELSAVLRQAWSQPSDQDTERIADELGDVEWYEAILYREFAFEQTDILRANIAKLRSRFPEKFSTNLALNRNTDKEESALSSALR